MATINSFNFGFIVIDKKQYDHDVIILPDGSVKAREASKARVGSHAIKWEDIERLVIARPEVMVIGTGANGLASLSRDAEVNLESADFKLMVLPSFDAVDKFNQLSAEGKRVAAIFHITC